MPNGKSCDKIINAVIVTPACRNGRRGGLKIHWWQHRAGSSPAAGTTPLAGNWTKNNVSALFLVLFSIKKGDPPNAADSLLLETRYRSIIPFYNSFRTLNPSGLATRSFILSTFPSISHCFVHSALALSPSSGHMERHFAKHLFSSLLKTI